MNLKSEQWFTGLNRQFMDILNEAENWFGKRDAFWTYIGIEFRDDGPYINYYEDKMVSLVLSQGCSKYPLQLFYQLAHETCHFLYPTGKADANVLNEGISTFFSKVYLEKLFPGNPYAINSIKKSNYYDAFLLVEELLSIDKNAIKKLREINSVISYATKEDLQTLNLGLSDNFIEKLIKEF